MLRCAQASALCHDKVLGCVLSGRQYLVCFVVFEGLCCRTAKEVPGGMLLQGVAVGREGAGDVAAVLFCSACGICGLVCAYSSLERYCD